MDSKAHLQELKSKVRAFCEARDWDRFHGAKDLSIGIITEASELLEHFRFRSDAEIEALLADPKKKAEIGHEMADVLYFLLRMGQMLDIDLSDALEAKMAENEQKYPVGKAKGTNAKYTELCSTR